MEYTNNNPLRVFTAFSGYDSQCMALDRLGVPYVLIGWSEIDKYAIQAHNAVYPEWADRNYGDISEIDWSRVPDFDLFTMSSPCQDFSIAGLQRGGDEGSGTRSSLLWECRKAILAKRPKYILFENVKALVSKKFLPSFRKWQDELASYGYSNFAKVLNAKDFGVPQNRERVFMVSMLDEDASFHFPEPFPLERRLKDILEEDVEERYYLSDKLVKGFLEHNRRHQEKGTGILCRPKTKEDIANALRANGAVCPTDNLIYAPIVYDDYNSRVAEDQSVMGTVTPNCGNSAPRNGYGKAVRKKYEAGELDESRHNMTDLVPRKDGISNTITSVEKDNLLMEPEQPMILQRPRGNNAGGLYEVCPTVSSSGFESNDLIIEICNVNPSGNGMNGRVISDEGIASTLSTNKGEGMKILLSETGFRIRKLTEREVFRLMDVSDGDIDRIQAAGISRSRQYALAGNSIVVSCLYHIFRKMFIDRDQEDGQLSLF